MLKKERQNHILHQLNLHNRVVSADLAAAVGVSEDTIRRDIQELHEAEKLLKVHGGGLSLSSMIPEPVHPALDKEAAMHYRIIGQKAASLIRDGMIVVTPGGQAVIEMIKLLNPDLRATFITGSVSALFQVALHPKIQVVSVGGKLSRDSYHAVGLEAVAKIKALHADLCFLSIRSIDISRGVMDNDWESIQVVQAMMRSSTRTIGLASSAGINKKAHFQQARLDQLDTLITELRPSVALLKPYKKAGLEII